MKRTLSILLIVTLISFHCTNDEVEPDCGCESETVTKELVDISGTLQERNPGTTDGTYYIWLDTDGSEEIGFLALISCDSLTFINTNFKDGSRVRISGDLKPNCEASDPKACRGIWIGRIVVKKAEPILEPLGK